MQYPSNGTTKYPYSQIRDTTNVRINVGTLKSLLLLVPSEERKEIIAPLATARRSPSRSVRTSSSRAHLGEERRGHSPMIPKAESLRMPGKESSLQPAPILVTPLPANRPSRTNVGGWFMTKRQSSLVDHSAMRSLLADELSRAAQPPATLHLSPSGKTNRTE